MGTGCGNPSAGLQCYYFWLIPFIYLFFLLSACLRPEWKLAELIATHFATLTWTGQVNTRVIQLFECGRSIALHLELYSISPRIVYRLIWILNKYRPSMFVRTVPFISSLINIQMLNCTPLPLIGDSSGWLANWLTEEESNRKGHELESRVLARSGS